MDRAKRNALVSRLQSEPEPQLVPIDAFFDGNDDLGSIGCNLFNHPGIETFRAILSSVAQRPDVEAVYAQIFEVDPGDDSWPFSDTVFVVGTVSSEALANQLAPLEPDEVGAPPPSSVPKQLLERHRSPVLMAWWD
jgi:hypothetical protein